MQDTASPAKQQPPPQTKPSKLKLKKGDKEVDQIAKKDALFDVQISAQVISDKDDKSASFAAKTSFVRPAVTAPGYDLNKKADADGNPTIKSLKGKFKWRGSIDVQTVYGPGASKHEVSCYGRGTTEDDVKSGNITLGFHEHCHRQDYAAYLRSHALPDLPVITLGMTEADYLERTDGFQKDVADYWAAMEAASEAATDEVGYTKSEADRKNDCYPHVAPAEDE